MADERSHQKLVALVGSCLVVAFGAQHPCLIDEASCARSGNAPENLERIFEPFFTTRKVGLGSGLALSISRNIFMEFGGDIRAESEVGVGTRVRVRLPVNTKKPEKTVEPTAVHGFW